MSSSISALLGWFHDCALVGINYGDEEGNRNIEISMQCRSDLGYPPWNGKKLLVTAIDVRMSRHLTYATAGPETIDFIRDSASPEFQTSMEEAERRGLRFPGKSFSVVFHSGAILEFNCCELRVEISE